MNFANGAQTVLTQPCGLGDATITVASSLRFPAAPFHIVVDTELMTVTAAGGTSWSVTRGIEGTGAQNHASGATVTLTVTAGDFAGFGGVSPTLPQCSMHLSASQGPNALNTEVLVALDTIDSDSTGTMANPFFHRINIPTTGVYLVVASIPYAHDNTGSTPWANNTGLAVNITHNGGVGGPYAAAARGLTIGGTFISPQPFAAAIIAATAGDYVALTAYAGADQYSIYVASPQTAVLQVSQLR